MTQDSLPASERQWKERLTAEQYQVCRLKGTEPAFSGRYWNHHAAGVYACAACGASLFDSKAKFDSGTGWPSFTEPVEPERVMQAPDTSYGILRTEILCARCGSHLGHVFDDGPAPAGLRYCVNSVSLDFREAGEKR